MSDFASTVRSLREPGNLFDRARPIYLSRAPGRLDVMGGNVDYTGGVVFEATIREATWAAAQMRSDRKIVLLNPQMADSQWASKVELSLDELMSEAEVRAFANGGPETRWTAYVLGVFHLLLLRWPERLHQGITLFLQSDVPLNKGVSSSAAVEVATMKAVAAVYGIVINGVELAEACQWVENVIAESACGIMDQAASVLGEEGCILPLLCQPCVVRPSVRLPRELRLWAIDSGVRHAVTGIEYEAARAAAFIGYRMICECERLPLRLDRDGRIPRYTDPRWNGYLSNVSTSLFRSHYEARLPATVIGDLLLAEEKQHADPFTQIRGNTPYLVRACTRYAVEEQQRIELFIELLRGLTHDPQEAGFRLLGDLMFQSHWSYTECGLGCEATDRLVALVREELGTGKLYGAKITGGGAGGTVVVLGSSGAGASFDKVVHRYAEQQGVMPYVFEGSSPGADNFGVQVIGADA
ncbi:MAG: L-arabinokinase [Edaphobacter sp.]|nr:L-arabinokinase [Edaphobacter sp.]